MHTPSAASPAAAAPPESSPDKYRQATVVLERFFERERNTFRSGDVAAIDHYFSYGEWGIAHAGIARVVQQRAAASSDGLDPQLLSAAALVLNESD